MSLAVKTSIGVLWNFAEQVGRQGIQTLTTLILAWYLVPSDYGLMSLAVVMVTVANVLADSGVRQYLIRAKEVGPESYTTALCLNVLLALLMYGIIVLFAPYYACIYKEQRLKNLLIVLGLVVPVNSFQIIMLAKLTRELNFKKQFTIAIPAILISTIISILLAVNSYGAWSLVAQSLIYSIIYSISLYIVVPFRLCGHFDKFLILPIFDFGYKLTIAGLVSIASRNLFLLLVGKFMSLAVVGYFFFAYKIQEIVSSQLTSSIQKVTFPALSKIQDDSTRLKVNYRRIIKMASYIIMPSMVMMIVGANPIILAIYGESWKPAANYLIVLSGVGMLHPLYSINQNVLKILGKSNSILKIEILKLLTTIPIAYFSVKTGIGGLLIGVVSAAIVAYLINCHYSIRMLDYSVTEQVYDFLPSLLLAVISGILVHVAITMLHREGLYLPIALIMCGLLFYVLLSVLFNLWAPKMILHIFREVKYGTDK